MSLRRMVPIDLGVLAFRKIHSNSCAEVEVNADYGLRSGECVSWLGLLVQKLNDN